MRAHDERRSDRDGDVRRSPADTAGDGGYDKGDDLGTEREQLDLQRSEPSSTPLTGQTSAKRHKQGTIFSFRLDQAATVKIAIQVKARGRRVGRSCHADSRTLRHKPRCTRTITIATLIRSAHAGLNKVAFSGRIRGKALMPGPLPGHVHRRRQRWCLAKQDAELDHRQTLASRPAQPTVSAVGSNQPPSGGAAVGGGDRLLADRSCDRQPSVGPGPMRSARAAGSSSAGRGAASA